MFAIVPILAYVAVVLAMTVVVPIFALCMVVTAFSVGRSTR